MELRSLRRSDLEAAAALDHDAFHTPAETRAVFVEWVDPARFVGAFDAGRLVGMAGVHGFGQFFGGRSVPMGGVTTVAVAPDRRGLGLGRQLSAALLPIMRERGEVLSTLYPATTSLYRRLGWELAGSHAWRQIAPRALERLPAPAGIRLRPSGDADLPARRACYERVARGVNGCLDRSDAWWERLRRHVLPQRSCFAAEDERGELVGYLVYRQLDGEYSGLGGPWRLACDDLVWTTRDAGLAVWRLLGSWASQVERVVFRGGPEDAALLLLPEQELQTLAEVRWLSRLVDAPAAIAARGYPEGLSAAVSIELDDPWLPANAGRFWLRVEKGEGRLEPGGPGETRLDVGALSSLYTGWATTAVLARAGRMSGGSTAARAALDAAFAGPTPWMLDEF
jgi:predicted acetyltransferase